MRILSKVKKGETSSNSKGFETFAYRHFKKPMGCRINNNQPDVWDGKQSRAILESEPIRGKRDIGQMIGV